ncbi:MAG: type II toxin-antitoxin system Phd/YefM family antitoxin [Opitutales bacterium]|nr:type II toxin-antitoxin system Phd/YefM family antitoxin [Opitutales bacterium]
MKDGSYKNSKLPLSGSAWQLQEAKACFSEVVRRAANAPQTVTVHGKPSAVVVSADYFERMRPKAGSDLVELMARAPLEGIEFGERGTAMPVREVNL